MRRTGFFSTGFFSCFRASDRFLCQSFSAFRPSCCLSFRASLFEGRFGRLAPLFAKSFGLAICDKSGRAAIVAAGLVLIANLTLLSTTASCVVIAVCADAATGVDSCSSLAVSSSARRSFEGRNGLSSSSSGSAFASFCVRLRGGICIPPLLPVCGVQDRLLK